MATEAEKKREARTMTCDAVQELLPEYMDGRLPSETQQELCLHLEDCPDCRAELLLERQLRETLVDAAVQPPNGLHERIMTAVREEQSSRRARKKMILRWTSLAAMLVCVCTAAIAFVVLLGPRDENSEGGGMMLPGAPFVDASKNECSGIDDMYASTNESKEELLPECGTVVTTYQQMILQMGEQRLRLQLFENGDCVVYLETEVQYHGTVERTREQGYCLRFWGPDGVELVSQWDAEGAYLTGEVPWEVPHG